MDAAGIAHRPAFGAPAAAVTLTATVTADCAVAARDRVATVPALPEVKPYTGHAFSFYFTGKSIAGERIYFAASQGQQRAAWTELNNGQPALTSTLCTKGLRDPFLIRSQEGEGSRCRPAAGTAAPSW